MDDAVAPVGMARDVILDLTEIEREIVLLLFRQRLVADDDDMVVEQRPGGSGPAWTSAPAGRDRSAPRISMPPAGDSQSLFQSDFASERSQPHFYGDRSALAKAISAIVR